MVRVGMGVDLMMRVRGMREVGRKVSADGVGHAGGAKVPHAVDEHGMRGVSHCGGRGTEDGTAGGVTGCIEAFRVCVEKGH